MSDSISLRMLVVLQMEHLNFRLASLFPCPARTSRVPQQQQLIKSAFELDGGDMFVGSTSEANGLGFRSGAVFVRSLSLSATTEEPAPERDKNGLRDLDLDFDCDMGHLQPATKCG